MTLIEKTVGYIVVMLIAILMGMYLAIFWLGSTTPERLELNSAGFTTHNKLEQEQFNHAFDMGYVTILSEGDN